MCPPSKDLKCIRLLYSFSCDNDAACGSGFVCCPTSCDYGRKMCTPECKNIFLLSLTHILCTQLTPLKDRSFFNWVTTWSDLELFSRGGKIFEEILRYPKNIPRDLKIFCVKFKIVIEQWENIQQILRGCSKFF